MKIMMYFLLASSVVFAGKIVPNVKWNQIERNTSGAAVALSKRNNINATASDSSVGTETELDLFISKDSLSSEVSVKREKSDFSTSEENDHTDTVRLKVGSKLTEKLSVGVSGYHYQEEAGEASSFMGISNSFYISPKFLIGGGLTNNHLNGSNFKDIQTYYIGVGYIEEGLVAETTLVITPSKEKNNIQTNKFYEIEVKGTISLTDLQISPLIYINKTENEKSDYSLSQVGTEISVEYMANKYFFVGGGVGYEKSKSEEAFVDENFNVTARLKKDRYQVRGILRSSSASSYLYNISGSYFF